MRSRSCPLSGLAPTSKPTYCYRWKHATMYRRDIIGMMCNHISPPPRERQTARAIRVVKPLLKLLERPRIFTGCLYFVVAKNVIGSCLVNSIIIRRRHRDDSFILEDRIHTVSRWM